MNFKITCICVFLSLVTMTVSNAQDSKIISLTISGVGTTKEEAQSNAIHYAIEQSFTLFFSSKKDVLKNNLIVSISNKAIPKIAILYDIQLPDGRQFLIYKIDLLVDVLSELALTDGIKKEVQEGLLTFNIKKQLLNEEAETKSIYEMIGIVHELMQKAFDYSMLRNEPYSLNTESSYYAVPIEVTAKANNNMDIAFDICVKSLDAIGLANEELQYYNKNNIAIYPYTIWHNQNPHEYNWDHQKSYEFKLRNVLSISALNQLGFNMCYYLQSFIVKSDVNVIIGDKMYPDDMSDQTKIYPNIIRTLISNSKYKYPTLTTRFNKLYYDNRYNTFSSNFHCMQFISLGENVAEFSFEYVYSLQELEKIKTIKIEPYGIKTRIKNGGVIVYEKNSHGLVVSLSTIKNKIDIEVANNCLMNLSYNGYSDWRLPTINELKAIDSNLNGKISLIHGEVFSSTTTSNPWKDSRLKSGPKGAYRYYYYFTSHEASFNNSPSAVYNLLLVRTF